MEPLKQGGDLDWTSGSSPRSVPDQPRIELKKRGGVPNWTQMCCLFFDTMLLSAHVKRPSVFCIKEFQRIGPLLLGPLADSFIES